MPQISVDFSNAADFSPMPVGAYWIEVKEAKLDKSSTKGEQMVKLVVEVIDHEEYEGRKLWPNLMLEGRGAGITGQALKAMNLPTDLDLEDLIGAQAQVYITQQLRTVEDGGDGRVRNKISTWITEEDEE